MSGRLGNCIFKTSCNQQINAIAKLSRENRNVIFGTVLDDCGQPVADAVVQLLQVSDNCDYPTPLTHTFTDDNGQFLIGPLCPNTTYMLKIYNNNVQIVNKRLKVNCYNGSCISEENSSNNSDNSGCGCQ